MAYGREAKPAPTSWNLIKTVLQGMAFWSIFLIVLPILLHRLESTLGLEVYRFSSSSVRVLGMILFALGSLLALVSCVILAIQGRGTPVPFDCPSRLVTIGPYRYVRNPMAVSGIVQGAGIGLFFGSPLILFYILVGLLLAETIIRPWEEADLERRFGDPYREYRRQVPRWFPSTRGYRSK